MSLIHKDEPTKKPIHLLEVHVADPEKGWFVLGFGYSPEPPDEQNYITTRILVDSHGLVDLVFLYKLKNKIPVLEELRKGRTTPEAIQKWVDEEWEPDCMHGVRRRTNYGEKGYVGSPQLINYTHGDAYVMMGFLMDNYTREEANSSNTFYCSMKKETLFEFVDFIKANPEPTTGGFKRYPPEKETP